MYIANQGVESGRAGLGSPRTLKEITEQNARLLEQQETLRRMLAEQQQMLVQQQAELQSHCDIIKKLFNQIEQMPKRRDNQGEELSLHDLHEKTDALLLYCVRIEGKLDTIPGVHSQNR